MSPRETIRSPQYGVGYVVKVGWSKDRPSLQVGVAGNEERSLFWMLLGTHLAELGAFMRDAQTAVPRDLIHPPLDEDMGRALLNHLDVVGPGPDSVGGYSSVWADLDREGCNDLIRTLRKARDAAFGRDE